MFEQIQGWHITIIVIIIGFVINIYVNRVGHGKDIASNTKEIVRHEKNVIKLFDVTDEIRVTTVKKEQCADFREGFTKRIDDIHTDLSGRFQKLDDKFDTYILNGRR